ncbi:unnamed protein product [Vicia faba]|uniref:F-box domain-containing protein n=1 Tax=Vicia faba TaxID=3906 RepID=A0AAV0ZN71_VICFA|nr:unnamed protein product [Vicia faba]
MDITLSDSNVEVSNHIPDDIVFSILSKLSLKSFKRFECVCKSWSLLFDNPIFMTMFRNYFISKNHSYYDGISLLLHLKGENALYSLSGERFENIVKLDWPKLSLTDWGDWGNRYSFHILGPISFDGTLFLQYYNNDGDRKFILWKPSTTEFRIISAESNCFPNVWSNQYQVGYDHVKDDYKMIRRTHSPHRNNHQISPFWEMYSLNKNSWRKIHDNFPHSYICGEEVYVNGVSHWWEKTKKRIHLVSFDFSKESFITTALPSYADDVFDFKSTRTRILTILNGSVAFMVNYEETNTFHISILGELGVKESWTKLFIVGPLPCLQLPIGIGKKGNILIRKKDNELAWFDISRGTIDEIGVAAKSHGKILFYKENFLPNGGIYSKFSFRF